MRKVLIVVVGLAIGWAASAHATTLVSNLGNAANGNLSPQNNFWMAQKFTTGASPFDLAFVQFRGARNAAQSVAVLLFSHNGGSDLPASLLATLDGSGITTTLGTQTVASPASIHLAATTSYWIVLAPSTIDTALWTQTTDLTSTGTGSLPNRVAFSSTSGSSWVALSAGNNLLLLVDVGPLTPVELLEFAVD